jgi:hypothetical protein
MHRINTLTQQPRPATLSSIQPKQVMGSTVAWLTMMRP